MWSAVRLAAGTCRCFEFGPLRICVRRTRGTWQFARSYASESDKVPGGDECPDDLEWTAFVPRSNDEQVYFQPASPDRPVVVNTEYTFQVAPGAGYTLYTGIPLWVRGWLGAPGGQLLFDFPTTLLSNTWFGGAMTGRLCYKSPNIFAGDSESIPDGQGSALCPLHVRNSSDHSFTFNKIAVLADLLRVYRSTDTGKPAPARRPWQRSRNTAEPIVRVTPGQLWTSEAYAHYSGEQELNVSVADHPPSGEHAFETLCEPREPDVDSIFKRSIILLRRISNYE
ncbi:MAG: hypothetical protein ACLFM0_03650 [Spirochaetales bacterium]